AEIVDYSGYFRNNKLTAAAGCLLLFLLLLLLPLPTPRGKTQHISSGGCNNEGEQGVITMPRFREIDEKEGCCLVMTEYDQARSAAQMWLIRGRGEERAAGGDVTAVWFAGDGGKPVAVGLPSALGSVFIWRRGGGEDGRKEARRAGAAGREAEARKGLWQCCPLVKVKRKAVVELKLGIGTEANEC
ncbi:hypothetical protein NXF25_006110, partial [Crotalus adamanteus]